MGLNSYSVLLVACLCLLHVSKLNTAPLLGATDGFCSGHDTLKYEIGSEYFYDYSTVTDLWINDVSKDSKTSAKLTAAVSVRGVSPCTYVLIVDNAKLTGDSVGATDLGLLSLPAQFKMNSRGELAPVVGFVESDPAWSRNIKRGVISAFQTKSVQDLRNKAGSEKVDDKSGVVYETDVLGRCRTTYSVDKSGSELKLEKKKSLQSCTLNNNKKITEVFYTKYRHVPEFYNGRLFIEHYECKSTISNELVKEVVCDERSTYKIGSRGEKGVQAVVKQTLTYKTSNAGYDRRALGPFDDASITFEFADKSRNEPGEFNLQGGYLKDLCERINEKKGLNYEHSQLFRDAVNKLESLKSEQLLELHKKAKEACPLAANTVLQAIVFANTEESFNAALTLIDQDEFKAQKSIAEFPLLSALARNKKPSAGLINKFKSYLEGKSGDFAYLNKLYLVYSSMVNSHCDNENCDENKLNEYSSLFAKNLGSNCADSSNKDLVVSSLKAIGNIGSFQKTDILNACATNKDNSLETRISAIQSFRRFGCDNRQGKLTSFKDLLPAQDEDTEVRINAFQIAMQCADSPDAQATIIENFPKLIDNEQNVQFLTYVVDYAREHGLTILLNPILNNPKIKEKFQLNFKELSFNNYKFRYNVARDSALEVELNGIYASDRAFVPRSLRINATLHSHGMSVNFVDATLRVEGADDVLRAIIVNKLTQEDIVKQLTEAPEQLIEILKAIADKLKYTADKPYVSLSLKMYGSEIYFSQLDTREELTALGRWFVNPRESYLYGQYSFIKNVLLVDSNVRQPLANGFEFNTFFDFSGAFLLSKDSTKTDEDDERKFNINNFKSLSATINKRFEIHLSDTSRLALKKRVVLNGRLRTNVVGFKKPGQAEYTLHLSPEKEIPVLTVDGKFYKLTGDNKYVEINDFTVEAKKIERCTSNKFHIATGIDLCLSVSRPQVGGSLLKALQPVDLDTLLEDDEEDNVDDHEDDHDDDDDDDDDDDEHDHDDDDDDDEKEKKAYKGFNRPKLTLSGPYHYHVTLKNPDGVKSLILRAEYERGEEGTELLAKAYSVSAAGEENERVELAYERKRTYTNLGFERKISLELRVPSTSSVPFKALAEISYQKKDSTKVRVEIDNKILTESHLLVNYAREHKAESDVAPHIELEILLDSKIRYPKFYRVFFDVEPSGKDIKSDFIIEYANPSTNDQKVKAVDAILTLTSTSESSNEYNVDLQVDTARPSKTHLYGILSTNMFASNVDLQLEYDGPSFKLTTPVAVKVSHKLDLSGNSKSHIEMGVRLPKRGAFEIDHNIKLIFEADAGKLQINHFEVQIVAPNSLVVDGVRQPRSVYISRHRHTSATTGETSYDLSFGINNYQIDLSTRPEGDRIGTILTKVDKNPIVKSFGVSYSRNTNPADNSRRSLFQVKKNDVAFIMIDASLASQTTPDQAFKLLTSINLKALDFTGNAKAKFDIEDNKNGVLSYNLDVSTEQLIRILFKIISINSNAKVDTNAKKVDFKFEITKLGEVKSVKLAASGPIRNGAVNGAEQAREFDVTYNKVFSNGQTKTGNGVVKFVWVPAKKVHAKLEVANALTAQFVLKKDQLSDENVSKEAHLRYSHLDDPTPSEREFKLQLATKSESGSNKQVTFNVLAKKGEPSKFDNVDALSYLIDINTQNTHLITKESGSIRVNGDNSVQIKLLQYRADWKSSLRTDLKSKQGTANIDLTVKFPAMFSDPGKQNYVSQKVNYVRNQSTRKSTLSYSIESDNKLLNERFKKATVDYVREAVNDQNQLNMDVKLTKLDGSVKTMNVKVERKSCENLLAESQNEDDDDEVKDAIKLCSGGKIFIKQDIVPTWESRFAPGKSFDATSCEIETRLIRKKDDEYLLDTLVAVTCKDKKLVKNSVYIHRDMSDEDQGKFQARLEADSDLYYPHTLYELKLKKPTRESGQVEISGIKGNREYTQRFNYERTLDEATGKLVKSSYQLSSVRNNGTVKYARSCDLKIEVGVNYYHKMACQVESPLLPAAANFGYSIKSNNYKESLFGKRDLEAELTLPTGRTLRLESKGQRKTPISGEFDHDDDDNDDREFESQSKIFIDYTRQPNRYIVVNAKRDNYENSKSKLSVEVLHYPGVKSAKVTVDRARLGAETTYKLTGEYELDSSAKNSLEWSVSLFSDLDQSKVQTELSLQRPKVNLAYKNKFDKRTGALQELQVKIGKLLKFVVEKDDPENRKISVVLASPDESAYDVETKVLESFTRHYKVQSTLKSKSGDVLSTLTSTFDSTNNNLLVDINANKNGQTYQLNFGIYSEKRADTFLSRNGKKVAQASLSIKTHGDHCDIELHAEWNRIWSQLRQDLLGLSTQEIATNAKYHSYLGDVYGELEKELKPTVESLRETRKAIQQDLLQSIYLYVDYYKYYMPQRVQDKLQELAKNARAAEDDKSVESLPLFKRVAIKYNRLSDALNNLRERVQQKSARLARRIPILAKISYDNESAEGFENDLTITKRTYRAHNLYQLNRLYRERLRRLAARMARTKGDLVRRDRSASLKQLYHKYKFRSLSAYTQVATVYNRRNVIAFNGHLRTLKTKCQYLLAHDLAKNKFSIILNNNDQEGIIAVYAYGQPAVEINAVKALVNGKAVSLPYEVNVPNKNAKILVRRVHNGVSLELIQGMKNVEVACYAESNSCTVSLTRFHVGKVNGLLGKSNHDLDNNDHQWYADSTCKATGLLQARKPTDDAVRTCFAKFSRTPFNPLKNAFLTVRPDSWQKLCENALSVDPSAKCSLLKAYAIHARIRNVEVHEPKECNQCSSNSQTYAIDKRVKAADSSKLVAEGSDFAFVFLPCDKKSAQVDAIKNFLGGVIAKNPKNKYYFVKVGPKGASIYQNEKGDANNVNIEQALNGVTEPANTNDFKKEYFAHGLFLAASLFSDRVSQGRRIIIVSCGNCLAYDPIDSLRLSFYLKQRNIIVSSFGQYDMIDEDNSSGSEQVVGHTSTHVLLYDNEEKTVIADGVESYSIDHKIDLCSRLASRTKGAVYNIALAAQPGVLEQIAAKVNEVAPKFSVRVNKCVRIETPFGDFDDFNYSRKQIDDEL